VDWEKLLLGDDLKDIEKGIDRFEDQMTRWRINTAMKMRDGFEALGKAAACVDRATARETFSKDFAAALAALDEAIESFSHPMHEREDFKAKMTQISDLAPGAAKFIRKQLRRVEQIRVTCYNALVDWHYGLLAFISEFEPEEDRGPEFSDPGELEAFLRGSLS
jgi:hypothetical protein